MDGCDADSVVVLRRGFCVRYTDPRVLWDVLFRRVVREVKNYSIWKWVLVE